MPRRQKKECPVCGKAFETVSATCSIKCARQAFPQATRNPDPTEDEIRAACVEIRKTWSPAETERRRVGSGKSEQTIKVIPGNFRRVSYRQE
jgi:hypothetical protein